MLKRFVVLFLIGVALWMVVMGVLVSQWKPAALVLAVAAAGVLVWGLVFVPRRGRAKADVPDDVQLEIDKGVQLNLLGTRRPPR